MAALGALMTNAAARRSLMAAGPLKVASPLGKAAPMALLSTRLKVSLLRPPSSSVSASTATETVISVSPAAKVRMPVALR